MNAVRAELVEALSFFLAESSEEGLGFDRLSPNGSWADGWRAHK
jgi:hypothetical protein